MFVMRALLLVIVVAACHPTFSVGYDARPRVTGPLAGLRGQTVAPRTALVGAEPTVSPEPGGNYSLAIGGGAKDFTISAALHAHDASGSTVSLPAAGSPYYLDASANLDFSWSFLRWKMFSTNIHAGPTRNLLLDRSTGERSWGNGVRYGGGAALSVKFMTVFADYYNEAVAFNDGAAQGVSVISGVMVGVALRPR
jgi:hypothetical protein